MMMPFEVVEFKGYYYIRVWWYEYDVWPYWRLRYMGQHNQTPTPYIREALGFTTKGAAEKYLSDIILNPLA